MFDPPGPDRPEPPRWAKVPAAVAHHRSLSDRAVQVFAVLARHADRAGRCWPSRETVAARAGCSVRSVDRALGELAAAGLIERTARGNGAGGRTSTLYTLTTAAGEPFAAVPEPALADAEHPGHAHCGHQQPGGVGLPLGGTVGDPPPERHEHRHRHHQHPKDHPGPLLVLQQPADDEVGE